MSNATIILLLSSVLCVPLGVGMIFWGVHAGTAAGMQPFPAVPVTGAAAADSLGERLKTIAEVARYPLVALAVGSHFWVGFRRRVGRPVSKKTSAAVSKLAVLTFGFLFSAMFVQMFAAQLPFQHFPDAEPGAIPGPLGLTATAAPYVSLVGFLIAAVAAGPLAIAGLVVFLGVLLIAIAFFWNRLKPV